MQNIVRESKLRHVYGEEQKLHFEEIRPSSLTSEGHLVKSNGSYVAFSWNTTGGGALCVLSQSDYGRVSPAHYLIKGHSANILDFDFNPFNDQQILTTCEDTFIRLWEFPPEGLTSDLVEPLTTLRGHTRKAALVSFHPGAAYICASTGFDYTVKVWNIETATAVHTLGPYSETCLSINWDVSGQLLGSTWRDKKVRIFDPRTEQVAQEFQAHEGGKASKFCWISETNTCFTCGFSKLSERQMALWDVRQMAQPLHQTMIDQSSGVLMPFYDPDTSLLFLAGKGDGNIRYYEVVSTEPYIHFIESYKSTVPCQGVSFVPKRKVDVTKCEIMKAAKLTKSSVELISFRVPRRAEGFQEDLYPDCVGMTPGCTASQWLEGQNTPAPKIPMSTLMSAAPVSEGIKGSFTQSLSVTQDPGETERLKREVENLSAALAVSEESVAASKANAEKDSERISKLQREKELLQQELEQLQSALAAARTECEGQKEALSKKDAAIASMNERLEYLTQGLETMEHAAAAKDAEVDGLREQLVNMQEALRAAEPIAEPTAANPPQDE